DANRAADLGRACARASSCIGGATRARPGTGGNDGADRGHREADHGRPLDELATGNALASECLDDVELERSRLTANLVQTAVVHGPPSFRAARKGVAWSAAQNPSAA